MRPFPCLALSLFLTALPAQSPSASVPVLSPVITSGVAQPTSVSGRFHGFGAVEATSETQAESAFDDPLATPLANAIEARRVASSSLSATVSADAESGNAVSAGVGREAGQPVPEPGTLLLVGSGLVGVALAGRSKRRRLS